MDATHKPVSARQFADDSYATSARNVAEEVAVAISFNGTSQAVLMVTPEALEDLAVGFSLSEGFISSVDEIESVEVVRDDLGFDVQLRLVDAAFERFSGRRRSMAGPVGCGLCGIESLEAARRAVPKVTSDFCLSAADVIAAVEGLSEGQALNAITHAVHAAGFYRSADGISQVREDVGRHNALDKVIGAMARSGQSAADGAFVVTSRVSVELVQKAAVSGAPMLIAISAPTGLALAEAEQAGITVVAVVRGREFEVFTHPQRVSGAGEA